MSVGVMIGSGVFLLPATLAPYGSISFLGWLVTSAGAIFIALVLGRLSSRTRRSGGFYVYSQEAFGDLTGFLMAWGYWIAIIFAITAISLAFAGYLGSVIPALGASNEIKMGVAAILIWTLTAINIKGVGSGALVQLITTILKIMPLIIIIGLGLVAGTPDNIPPYNPQNLSLPAALSATALLTMWAFIGIEAGVVAAEDVIEPEKTIPRAVVAGTLTATLLYILATAAVMMLVPVEVLAESEAPFVDAAKQLGSWGPGLIAFGALVSTAGSANGNVFLGGQMPMAVAIDGLAPKFLARRNKGQAPVAALVISSVLATLLLLLNLNDTLIGAFTFLISMSTLCTLLPYAISALAEIKHTGTSSKFWLALAVLALAYSCMAMLGSGVKLLVWGLVLFLAGLPVYWMSQNRSDL